MFMRTVTGLLVDPSAIKESDIDIRDIAISLSRQCRFGGHLLTHYSVAQHSVLVSDGLPPSAQLEGLLHDASEAYLNDITTPVKTLDHMKGYVELEAQVMRVIAKRFGLGMQYWAAAVKKADRRALAMELRDVCPGGCDTVTEGKELTPVEPLFALPTRIVPLPAEKACGLFIQRFGKLIEERG